MIFFDIETRPLPLEQCERFMPEFEAPSNYKDAAKIADNIAEQRAKWLERAALSPLTGQILAIGLKHKEGDEIHLLHGDDERDIIKTFVAEADNVATAPIVGFNIAGFDIPFIIRRAWALGIKTPKWWTSRQGFGKPELVVDLMVEFQCGDRRAPFIGLDPVAKFLGFEGKTGAHAKDFGELYVTDQVAALAYLKRDVELVEQIHDAICV